MNATFLSFLLQFPHLSLSNTYLHPYSLLSKVVPVQPVPGAPNTEAAARQKMRPKELTHSAKPRSISSVHPHARDDYASASLLRGVRVCKCLTISSVTAACANALEVHEADRKRTRVLPQEQRRAPTQSYVLTTYE
ncbi:hypothetical protein EDB84DRAFT_525009 [Lactarius hengduanensis]|nr:hypothetical protein EDB85DRAFT_530912 [Lactarius pseudohatsudake]KAH9047203.1 hypothetical protein EDB84DRAFT_525009 [Lactarius hengduanensis]